MFGLIALTAASTEVCIDMFLTGAVTAITLLTTGSKVKNQYTKSRRKNE